MRIRLWLALVGAMIGTAASAHLTGAPHEEAPGWTWDPWIWLPLAIGLILFSLGWLRLYRRASNVKAQWRRLELFVAGWLVLAGALLSPLHQAGERAFSAHMAEHELLMLVAAPLLVLAEPLAVMLWALPAAGRRTTGALTKTMWIAAPWQMLTSPLMATFLQTAMLWVWHSPSLFERALESNGWHIAQHLSFLLSALLFWTAMLSRRTARGLAALCLFFSSLISGALGALMAFAQSPWYEGYARLGLAPFGLTPVEDQQIAGLIMWIPGGLIHAAAALVIVGAALTPPPAGGAAVHAG